MYHRSDIMKAAHRYAQAYKGRQWSYAFLLKHGLKTAWAEAKHGLTTNERRAASIRAEIDALQYKTLRYDTVAMRRRLETELAGIAA
ncbi:MAG: hypothetical protein BGO03_11995 [Mesorhizobium sp. 61-13]|nr:hypothetical protein [Mesorhizobium sp.]OJU52372.1 MAG: hypothetical protein BGO03_11995 [Mesorhizobium sp. 61-13]